MPVFNHGGFVSSAIQSVLAQTCADWELIAVDDGSSDDSGEILDAAAVAEPRLRVIHQANAGPAQARNRGIAEARGAWLAFLDSDDTLYPHALESYARYIDAHPAARFIYGFRHRLLGDEVRRTVGEHQDHPTGTAELFERVYIGSSSVCFRRDSLDGMDVWFDPALPPAEDYELFLRLSLKTPLEPLGEAVGLRRRHGGNISRQTGRSRLNEARMLERFAQGPGAGRLDPSMVALRVARVFCSAGREHFRAGNLGPAIESLDESLARRWSMRAWAMRAWCRAMRTIKG